MKKSMARQKNQKSQIMSYLSTLKKMVRINKVQGSSIGLVHRLQPYLTSAFLVKKFSPAKHLNTLPELVNRKFNRPTVETLKKNVIAHAPDTAGDDKVRFRAVGQNILC